MANYTSMPRPLKIKLPGGSDEDIGYLLYQGDLTKLDMLSSDYEGCRAYNPTEIKNASGAVIYGVGWYQVTKEGEAFVWKRIYDPGPSSVIPVVYEMPYEAEYADTVVLYEGADTTVAPIYHKNHMYLGVWNTSTSTLSWSDLMSGKIDLPGTTGSILQVDAVGEPKWSDAAVLDGDILVWDTTTKKFKPETNKDNIPVTPGYANTIPYANEYAMGKFNVQWTSAPTEEGQLIIYNAATNKWEIKKSGGNVPSDPTLTGQILVAYPDSSGVPKVTWTGQPLVNGHSPVWDTATHTWTFDFGGKVKVVNELPDATDVDNAGFLYLYNGPEVIADALFTNHVYYLDSNMGAPVYIDLSARRVEECANVDYIMNDANIPDKAHLIWNKTTKLYEHKQLEVNRYTDCYVGEIKIFAYTDVPHGWLICDGSEYEIAAYPDLYRKIGKMFDGAAIYQTSDYVYLPAGKSSIPSGAVENKDWSNTYGTFGGVKFNVVHKVTTADQAIINKKASDEYHFRVPNLIGRFVEGSDAIQGVGLYTKSSIPNSAGKAGASLPWSGDQWVSNPFYVPGGNGGWQADGGDGRPRMSFDLSRSSSTYTNNNHKVQPPSLRFVYAICASMTFTEDEDITSRCTLYGHEPDKTSIIKRSDVIEANIFLNEMSTMDTEKVICILPDGMKSAYYRGVDSKHIDDIHIEAHSDKIVQSKGDGTPSPVLITFTLE